MSLSRASRLNLTAVLLGLVPFVVLFGAWQALVDAGVLNPFLASSPDKVFSALGDQISSGIIFSDLGVSIVEFVVAFGLALVVGVAVGVPMGWYRRFECMADPLVWLLYASPVVALYPVFTLTLGLGQKTVIAIAFLLAVPPILLNAAKGVREADPLLVRAARSLCGSERQIFTRVAMPAAVPLIMAGVRLGVGRALVGVVIGEFFAGAGGIGYSISYYGGLLRTSDMIATVLVVGLLGVLLTQLTNLVERRIDAWRPNTGS